MQLWGHSEQNGPLDNLPPPGQHIHTHLFLCDACIACIACLYVWCDDSIDRENTREFFSN